MHKDELSIADEPRKLNRSGSLCPAVKAADMIGDKWTLLILRELLIGANRYNEFQRAMPRISPTILSKRLKQMEQDGLIIKKSVVGGKGHRVSFDAVWPGIGTARQLHVEMGFALGTPAHGR
jgi:DNA-binding HxlR family transcriptional regulator